MDAGLIGRATGMFAVTNVDDLLLLAVYFGRAAGDRRAEARIVLGQYLGFGVILAAAVAGALTAALLPRQALPYLGLVPLALGLRLAWTTWRARSGPDDAGGPGGGARIGAGGIAAVTCANGSDNIGVYVPVFAASGPGALTVYAAVFLILVAVWCALGRWFATRPVVARALSRGGHVLLPAVLVAIGVLILVEGGAFGL